MEIPWRKKVRISMNEQLLESFIKDILSDKGTVYLYRSAFQELVIDRNVKDISIIRDKIREYLK